MSWSSTADVTTDTTVTVQASGWTFFQGRDINTWYDLGTFTIKADVKELQVSTPTNSSTVTEAGSTSTFTVKLGLAPSANVTVNVSSGDTSEGSVSPNTLTFTTMNYSTAQTVTVTGANDSIYDGSVN